MVNHPLMFAVKLVRREVLANAIDGPIKPADWRAVDRVIARLFHELMVLQTEQAGLLMQVINDMPCETPEGLHEIITNGQVVSTALSSLILAHFEVILENERQVNDAHLHLDRTLRAAETGQGIIVKEMCREDQQEEKKPKPRRKSPPRRKP